MSLNTGKYDDTRRYNDTLVQWIERYNKEKERADGLEMDIVYLNAKIRELQSELAMKIHTIRTREVIDGTINQMLDNATKDHK